MNINELKAEIEEIRASLSIASVNIESEDCDYNYLMGLSVKLDQLILEYIEKTACHF